MVDPVDERMEAGKQRERVLPLIDAIGGREVSFLPRRLFLAGYTGRDREHIQRHIDELLAQGIPAPEKVPELYPGMAEAIQVGGRLPPGRGWSSGEIEYVLFETASGVYVGVGSDHTDRELERRSVVAAKQAFPKIVGRQVWPLSHLAPDWDSLILRSWLSQGTDRRAYQDSPLAAIIPPLELLGLIPAPERGEGLVIFSGTVAALQPAPASGPWRFDGELLAPGGRVLAACSYEYEAGPSHVSGFGFRVSGSNASPHPTRNPKRGT